MIQFFLKNEAIINLICFGTFLTTLLVPNIFHKAVGKVLDMLFLIAFSTCFLNVLLNGINKGF